LPLPEPVRFQSPAARELSALTSKGRSLIRKHLVHYLEERAS
jgi:hypothetical protein